MVVIRMQYVATRILTVAISTLVLSQGILLLSGRAEEARPADVLRVGFSGVLTLAGPNTDERTALAAMQAFLKEETGFTNEFIRQRDWAEVADNVAKGQLQFGILPGFQFAWAQARQPGLKPLVLAVNGPVYRHIHLVARHDNPAVDFAGLQGQSLTLPTVAGGDELNLFVERLCRQNGKPLKEFFAKVATPDNFEDPLDDVVDGVVQAAVVDRVALEAYKHRKLSRFHKLRDITHSAALPPMLVAYGDGRVEASTLTKVEQGLQNASRSVRGRMLATMFHLDGFERPPKDFDKVVAETRTNYPPPAR